MKFIFDECLSDKIPRALNILGEPAYSYKEHWSEGAPDVEWIPSVAKRGWAVVTSDHLKPHERVALVQNKGRIFLLGVKNLPFWEHVKLVIKKWEDIKQAAKKQKPPYIIRVPKRGKLEKVLY